MKKLFVLLLLLSALLFGGCRKDSASYDLVATTLPVYEFALNLCDGTGLSVGRLITDNVSCLHDYTLQVGQMKMIEGADMILLSGLGLEDFMEDAIASVSETIDASADVHIHDGSHDHPDTDSAEDSHHHDTDPHIWLSPEHAIIMAENLAYGLSENYPQFAQQFSKNLAALKQRLVQLQAYGDSSLANLSCRELITFHDGFSYFAESFDLTIVEAVEEESGSEASASMIIHLAELVNTHNLPAVFTETNGSDACAGIIHSETGAAIYTLDMAMSGDSYFEAMYHNIDTIREALG